MEYFEPYQIKFDLQRLQDSNFRKQLLDDAVGKKTDSRIFQSRGKDWVYSVQPNWAIPEIESILEVSGIKRVLYFVMSGAIRGSIHQDANVMTGRHTKESYIIPIENCHGVIMSWYLPNSPELVEYFEGAEIPSKVPFLQKENSTKIAMTNIAHPTRVNVHEFHAVRNTLDNLADFISIRFE